MHKYTKKELMTLITGKLRRNFGRDVEEATSLHMFKACALVLRDIMSERQMKTADRVAVEHLRQVHYLSLEFLMGRSLLKNAYNLGVAEPLKQAIEGLGFSAPDLFEAEPDAGLGNGGLGRLAACYLDSMTTLEIPATGYSICHDLLLEDAQLVADDRGRPAGGAARQLAGAGRRLAHPQDGRDRGGPLRRQGGGRVGRAGPPPGKAHRV